MKLRISPDLVFDESFVTDTQAIMGVKGMGKSTVAQVQAEELLEAGNTIVAIDPTDAWWGLRSSADGKSEGYPVVIFGGDHAMLPIPTTTEGIIEIADAVIKERFSCVLCTDGLPAGTEVRVVREFLDRIYRKNRDPLHLFVDEADMFATQTPFDPEDAKSIRTMANIVRRGRKKGLGCTLITQRPAALNKDVLAMCDLLILMGMSQNHDIEQVQRRLKNKRNPELVEEIIDSLPVLQVGDAWVWNARKKLHQRFRARPKRSFDSGETPKAGKKRRLPRVLSTVDLQKLGATIAAAAEQAKASDPKELKKKLTELTAKNQQLTVQLEKLSKASPAASRPGPQPVEHRPTISAKQLARIERLVASGAVLIERWDDRSADAHAALVKVHDKTAAHYGDLRAGLADLSKAIRAYTTPPAASLNGHAKPPRVIDARPHRVVKEGHGQRNGHKPMGTSPRKVSAEPADIKSAHRKLLNAIAMMEQVLGRPPSRGQVAIAARLSPTTGSFNGNIGKLRAAGMIDYPSEGTVSLTDEGRAHVDSEAPIPNTNEEFHAQVRSIVKNARWRLLEPLIEVWPDAMTRAELAERTGLSQTTGSFNGNLGKLRTTGFLSYPADGLLRAEDILFIENRN